MNNASLAGAAGATPGCQAADITVSGGGTVGSNTVSFNIANIAACGAELNFTSANGVQLNATNANFNTTLTRQLGNTPINGGSGTTNSATTGAFIQQLPGISFRGATPVPSTTILLAGPAYTTLAPAATNFVLNVRRGTNLVGTDEVTVHSDLTGSGVAGALVNTATASLGLQNAAGFSVAASGIGAGPSTFGATNSANIVADVQAGASAAAGGNNLAITLANAASGSLVKFTQNVTVTPTVAFTAASGLTASTYAPVTVGRLSREGQQTQPFTWVGDGVTTSAISVFRHTGLGATAPTIRFLISNASAGASFNGEYVIPAGSITLNNGEAVTTSLLLSQIAGNFGRADVTFVFDRALAVAPATNINTQRFIQSPTGALTGAPEENANRNNNQVAFPAP